MKAGTSAATFVAAPSSSLTIWEQQG
jgi:hypothetical protein